MQESLRRVQKTLWLVLNLNFRAPAAQASASGQKNLLGMFFGRFFNFTVSEENGRITHRT